MGGEFGWPTGRRRQFDQSTLADAFIDGISVFAAKGAAYADSQINEALRAGLAPFDIATGAYNIGTGDGGLRDYFAVAGAVPVGKTLGIAGAALGIEAKSFTSFSALKRYLGSPGEGNHWHHIVEKTPGNLKIFGAEVIHNIDNVIAIPASTHVGKGSISAYYSSIRRFSDGKTVRQWLSTQSFEAQQRFGLDTLKSLGH